MKKNSIALLMLVSYLGSAQPDDPFMAFATQKESIDLTTGITMKYVQMGPADGIPVLLLHGYTDSSRSFQLMIDELARRHRRLRIIAPDMRGHGASSMPDAEDCASAPEQCFRMEDFAADILALMDQLQIGKAYVVGHSLGSVVAQELALHHPERLNGLVLIGTFINGKESSFFHEFLMASLTDGAWKTQLEQPPHFHWPADAYSLTPADLGDEVTSFLRENWVTEACASGDLLEAIYPETINTRLGTWIGAVRTQGAVDNRARLKGLRTPTLVLWATQDGAFPDQPDQMWVKSTLKEAAAQTGVRVIYKTYGKLPLPNDASPWSDLGHNLQWAAPKEVAIDVATFIRTGFPETNHPFADPKNRKRVLRTKTNANIEIWEAGTEMVSKR